MVNVIIKLFLVFPAGFSPKGTEKWCVSAGQKGSMAFLSAGLTAQRQQSFRCHPKPDTEEGSVTGRFPAWWDLLAGGVSHSWWLHWGQIRLPPADPQAQWKCVWAAKEQDFGLCVLK